MPNFRAHVRITGRSKDASEVTFQAYDELASRLISAMEATALAKGPDPVDRRRFTLTLLGTDMVALINASLGDDAANLRISVQETQGWPFRASGSHRRVVDGSEAGRMVIRDEPYLIEVTSWEERGEDGGEPVR
jgi:hypothetical protein